MKCDCLDGKIGRPDLPEGEETCWQCEGTGFRKNLVVEGFGAFKYPEGIHILHRNLNQKFYDEIRSYMEKNKPTSITVNFKDGALKYTMTKHSVEKQEVSNKDEKYPLDLGD
jgi:hypothetical protein